MCQLQRCSIQRNPVFLKEFTELSAVNAPRGNKTSVHSSPSLVPRAQRLSIQCGVRFRPCIVDIHKGKVKQIVGSTLQDSKEGDSSLTTNDESDISAAEYAKMYKDDELTGGHVIMLGADPLSQAAAIEALHAYPGSIRCKERACLSWRLAVETHNIRGRNNLVPEACVDHVSRYMLDGQYTADCELVADEAVRFAESVELGGDGKDVWVFDIDETTLSNVAYYIRPDVRFGSTTPDLKKFFDEWVVLAAAPAVPGMRRLYNRILDLGFKVVILTGSLDSYRDIRTINLRKAGFDNWENIIFKGIKYKGISTLVFKSEERTKLVTEGYRIVGNVGDQWSDLSGDNVGMRTFKVPNPLHFS